MKRLLMIVAAAVILLSPQLAGPALAETPLDRTVFALGDPTSEEAPGRFNVKALELPGSPVYFWNGDIGAPWHLVQFGQAEVILGTSVRFAAGRLDGALDGTGGGTDEMGRLAVIRLELGTDPGTLSMVDQVALLRTLATVRADLLDLNYSDAVSWSASRPISMKWADTKAWLVYRFPKEGMAIAGRTIVLRFYPPAQLQAGTLPTPEPSPVQTSIPAPAPAPTPTPTPTPQIISRQEACDIVTGAKTMDETVMLGLEAGNLVIDGVGADTDLTLAIYDKALTDMSGKSLGKGAANLAGPTLDLASKLGLAPCVPIGDTSVNSLLVNASGAIESLIDVFSHLPWWLGCLWFVAGLLQALSGIVQIIKLLTRPGYSFLENLLTLVTTNEGLNAIATTVAGIAGIVGGLTLMLGIGALVLAIATIVAAAAACFQFAKDFVKALQVTA
jgi:hypothetical protein